jgi:hypothetical protein
MERLNPTITTTPGGMTLKLAKYKDLQHLSRPEIPKLSSLWEFNFLMMLQFRDREGHMKVPRRHVEDGQKLGAWFSTLRAKKKARKLLPEEERRLNEIGVVWSPYEEHWETMFRALIQFKEREGHSRVPTTQVEDGLKLGRWISDRRTQKTNGMLTSEKERRLNDIGLVWNPLVENWDNMVRALTQFKQREGHYCPVSVKHIEHMDGGVQLKLGTWLRSRRYEKWRGKLDAKREKRLESLGVKWKNYNHTEISEEHFDRNFDLLLVFKEREGHVRVPVKHQESATDDLGAWLEHQRYLHRSGLLELDRQKWLEIAGVTLVTRK